MEPHPRLSGPCDHRRDISPQRKGLTDHDRLPHDHRPPGRHDLDQTMTTNPPPCYHCGLRPAMLPIAYCADCYRLTGARLLTAAEVATTLGLDRSRIHQLSRLHGIGLPAGPRNTRLYTPAMVDTLRTIRRPGGRPVTYLFDADYDTIIYETHRDGSPALWLETTADGVRTLNDAGGTPLVLAPGDDVDEAVAAWRESVAWETAVDEARAAADEAEYEATR